ncbi:MAG: carboxymuconolactone decarboxylase family protein [Dehalococcoidia bacterium]|nr:carboxymuconolactone decarboxylase family protein [Dehalococcoidia bacterium]
MARIPLLDTKDDLPPDAADAYDAIAASRGRIVGPYRALLHSPELAQRIAHTGSYVRFESSLPGDVRELAIISVARTLDCRFEWAAHSAIARNEGVREEAIDAIRAGKADGLDEVEREVWTYTNQLLDRHRASDEAFAAVEKRYGTKGVVDLTGTIGYYSMIASTLNAFEIEPPEDWDQLPVSK